MFFCGWTWTSFLTIFLLHFASARKGSFLQYDAECPFLSDEEYEKRMIKRRCPATTPTPPPPTTTEKVKNISRLSKGAKRFMLKFVSLGKSRSASIQLNSHTSNNLTIMEGTFLSVHCSQSFTKKNKTVANVTWYFNGEPIKDDLVNWRMQPDPVNAELRITPVLAKLDNGYFECYIDDQWSGGLVLSVETTLMPLGIFGGGGNNGPKPQPLNSEKKEKREKGSGSGSGLLEIKDSKGTTIKLGKKSYTVEKKLAEGGFALVYLVCDKHNRNYALKRQLIRDDPRQIEACRTECQIVKNLNGHKNIVAYVNHQLTVNKVGIYDYMLLTVYYPTNVLQLMNSRLLSNRWLITQEILDIFCDVCEAVARLHHSKTPVIHRDLKVENVLVDQRTGNEKSVYVLCDFGSATTKVLSKETHTQAYMEEEIRRYTTLSYRAPEMIDLFSGIPITTKSDIWALGVMLYKLCYFSLPFGESALAIQNGTFNFPDQPEIPEEIKAIINLLLTSSARHRPNIFQTSYLAFSAVNRKCPIYNIERSPRIELTEAVQILRMRAKLGANYSRLFEKAFNDFENSKRNQQAHLADQSSSATSHSNYNTTGEGLGENSTDDSSAYQQQHQVPSSSNGGDTANLESFITAPVEGVIVNTSTAGPRSSTTSVNPRLRPKATNASNKISSPFAVVPPVSARNASTTTPTPIQNSAYVASVTTTSNPPSNTMSALSVVTTTLNSSSTTVISQPAVSIAKTEEGPIDIKQTSPQDVEGTPFVHHPLITSEQQNAETNPISSCLKSSAFKPYSMIAKKSPQQKSAPTSPEQIKTTRFDSADDENVTAIPFESSNPFISASASGGFTFISGSPPTMDDNLFGERFDELRRINRRNTIEGNITFNSMISSSRNVEDYYLSSTAENQQTSRSIATTQFSLDPISSSNRVSVSDYQMQKELFLATQKKRFVRSAVSTVCANSAMDLGWLERAVDEDPFGRAPPIPQHQLAALGLMDKAKT